MQNSGEKENNTESSSRKKKRSYSKTLVTEKDILVFAKQILIGLMVLFVFCALLGVYSKIQFFYEIIKMGILPAFASVVTYYFAKDKT